MVTEALTTTTDRTKSLREIVTESVDNYLKQLGDQTPSELYDLVIEEIEPALFESVLKYTSGNKVIAARLLGISRTTLHTRLKEYFSKKLIA